MNFKDLKLIPVAFALLSLTISCQGEQQKKTEFIRENVAFAVAQTDRLLQAAGEPTGKNYPRTMKSSGELAVTNMYDWTSGFFPGNLWYLYELTDDARWKAAAEKWTVSLDPLKTHTGTHDLGFMMYCSYGNAERLAPNAGYQEVLIESANSLCSRFSEKTGVIKSWNSFRPWNDTVLFRYPVIIDNMMNLEMLFYASKVSGDKKYYDIAVKHADATLKNHFREDFSTYHVLAYDTASPRVLGKYTGQGFSDNSTWARGQAWAIYGFTMVYRETRDPKYLDVAIRATDFYLKHLPEDFVPFWDFNAGEAGYTPGSRSYAAEFHEKPRDASAAAIVCSALFELSGYANRPEYRDSAVKMLHSLASPAYRAALGSNADFLLMHSVGSIPHQSEIDKPLVYADYYFLEALIRYSASANPGAPSRKTP
ncbi:MAG: glycoside hydrolase family 88 protein [Dysgonamonadaceae bacterium]|jgi:rhamnogalacturonyl hydrolase YesR|nr:glycoside hydrolase family 88 protein [Dysgonamonadaceae bacterium]